MRQNIVTTAIEQAIDETEDGMKRTLAEKGHGSLASRHEVLGILEEEMHELNDSIKSGDLEEVKKELMDVAVGAIFAIACINEGTLDW